MNGATKITTVSPDEAFFPIVERDLTQPSGNRDRNTRNTRVGYTVALQRFSHIYGGTVEPHVIAARRAKNKSARTARRNNRRSK